MMKITINSLWKPDNDYQRTRTQFKLLNDAHRICRRSHTWLLDAEYEEFGSGFTFTYRFDPKNKLRKDPKQFFVWEWKQLNKEGTHVKWYQFQTEL